MATNNPWDGSEWNIDGPDIDQPLGNAYKEIFSLRRGIEQRINKEHLTLDNDASPDDGGEHVQGSARAFHLATASIPNETPNGDPLIVTDNGMLWHDITTDIFYCLNDHSDPTVDGGWLNIGTLLGSIAVNTDKFTVAAVTGNTLVAGTLDASGDFKVNTDKFIVNATTGAALVAGQLSITGDLKVNTDKFTVAAATGNTVIAGTLDVTEKATLGDTSVAVTQSVDDNSTQIATTEYVDNSLANQGVQAWGKVAPDGTLAAGSFNIASATRDSAGTYTVTYTTAFTDALNSVMGTLFSGTARGFITVTPSSGNCTVRTWNASGDLADMAFMIMACGAQ